MSRRDTIIVAALVNVALLALLFMLAVDSDDDAPTDRLQVVQNTLEKPLEPVKENVEFAPAQPIAIAADELDNALQEYSATAQPSVTIETEQLQAVEIESPQDGIKVPVKEKLSDEEYKEVVVKKGDSLDKIAKAHGVTVKMIKDASDLTNEKLKIGQVLKVPVKKTAPSAAKEKSKGIDAIAKNVISKEKVVAMSEPQYYTIKSGDNPWKIAKQFGIKVDDLLKLNGLNEEKARNLKVGDKIRVK